MELLREETQIRETNAQSEQERHNAMINEHYQKLLNAVNGQLAEDTNVSFQKEEKTYNTNVENENVYISPNVNTVNSVNYEQAPRVTEYLSRASSALFTADKFEQMKAMQMNERTMMTPTYAPAKVEAVQKEVQYSLSNAAKTVIVTFAVAIVGMLTLIGVNTNAINQKRMNIEALETRKAELVEMSESVQERIQQATSEETIREYAESQGMVQARN